MSGICMPVVHRSARRRSHGVRPAALSGRLLAAAVSVVPCFYRRSSSELRLGLSFEFHRGSSYCRAVRWPNPRKPRLRRTKLLLLYYSKADRRAQRFLQRRTRWSRRPMCLSRVFNHKRWLKIHDRTYIQHVNVHQGFSPHLIALFILT